MFEDAELYALEAPVGPMPPTGQTGATGQTDVQTGATGQTDVLTGQTGHGGGKSASAVVCFKIAKDERGASKGHCFVIVATDYFTKWTEAIPLKNMTHK